MATGTQHTHGRCSLGNCSSVEVTPSAWRLPLTRPSSSSAEKFSSVCFPRGRRSRSAFTFPRRSSTSPGVLPEHYAGRGSPLSPAALGNGNGQREGARHAAAEGEAQLGRLRPAPREGEFSGLSGPGGGSLAHTLCGPSVTPRGVCDQNVGNARPLSWGPGGGQSFVQPRWMSACCVPSAQPVAGNKLPSVRGDDKCQGLVQWDGCGVQG